jgi:uncharacterized protein (TIGR02117 family)
VSFARPARKFLRGLAVVILAFCLVALVTARSGDPSLYPPRPAAATIEIFVVNHGYHSGIVLPRAATSDIARRHGYSALTMITTRFAPFAALEIGWGDEGFYRLAPTLSAVTLPLALRALLWPGNPSVLHVVGLNGNPLTVFTDSDLVSIRLSIDGFVRMLAQLDATFARTEAGELPPDLGRGLYGPSLFFRAVGAFHIFNVCNHWVARLLDAAGVPTAPALAMVPPGLLFDLRWRAGLRPMNAASEADAR